MSAEHRFTVLTPTYNRAYVLPRLYESLCAQTFRNFEWVIVDDGSADGTRELVAAWKPSFPLHYYWQPNGGMHRALNLGISKAKGEFCTQIDDDDRCVPHTLSRFDEEIKQLPDGSPHAFINALCYKADGCTVLGTRLPADRVDTYRLRDALALATADRCGMVRTEALRQFPFPEFPGEKYVIPGVVWNRMHQRYAARWFNEPLKIVGYAPGHMSSQDLRRSSPRGAALYHAELAMHSVPLGIRLRSAINAVRFAALALAR